MTDVTQEGGVADKVIPGEVTDRPVGVAVLGLGTVGSEVVRLMSKNAASFTARIGAPLALRGVAVRDTTVDRGIDPELLTDDPDTLVERDDVDVVIELIGGIDVPRRLVSKALAAGKSVVTANKALLAEHTTELAELAARSEVDLYFEAAVAGAIPVVGPLRRSLAGDEIVSVMGIVNATTNFILTEMAETGAGYADTVEEARRLGLAEADPTADVEGYDAASKAAILASLAFHTRVTAADVHREGITAITPADFRAASSLGCTIKLVASCDRIRESEDDPGRISARVYPALVPLEHPLATVNGAFNAVVIQAEAAGRLMFYGKGGGGTPTASAVLGDLVAAARNRVRGGLAPEENPYASLPIVRIGDITTRYYVNMNVDDKSGVLAGIADIFAANDVSISEVRQVSGDDGAELIVLTHLAGEAALAKTVEDLEAHDMVQAINSVIRLEGMGD